MIDFLHVLLYPIIYVLRIVFEVLESITTSAGLSIILLSLLASILLIPLQRKGRAMEDRFRIKFDSINLEIADLKKTMKGEALFRATEKVYEAKGYHPIQSVVLGVSFLISIPVLIAALLLFTTTDILDGKSFLFLSDLSKPDNLLFSLNILPLLMSAITIIDANYRFKDDKSLRYRFYFIAIVLLFLVYGLPAGLVLYWTTSNIVSFYLSWKGSAAQGKVQYQKT